jgi:hypothetical protein
VQLLLEVASCLTTLTDLSVEARENVSIDGAPLRRLPQLARLTFGKAIVIGPKHLQHIKQMESLKYLYINYGKWSAELLQALCGLPHKLLKLEEVSLANTSLTSAHLQALSSLPALTSLHPPLFPSSLLATLCRFSGPDGRQLRSLTLRFPDAPPPPPTQQLLGALESVGAGLAELNLDGVDIVSQQQFTAFFSSLPQIQVLNLGAVQLPSLVGLRSLTHLRELSVELCYALKPEHLEELALVPSLRHLTLAFFPYHADRMEQVRDMCRSPRLSHFTLKMVTKTLY